MEETIIRIEKRGTSYEVFVNANPGFIVTDLRLERTLHGYRVYEAQFAEAKADLEKTGTAAITAPSGEGSVVPWPSR